MYSISPKRHTGDAGMYQAGERLRLSAVALKGRTGGALQAAAGSAASAVQALRRAMGKLRRAGWALADQCVVSAANFFTIYLFALCLEPSVFGAFMLAYTGLLLLTNLQSALVVQPHNVLGAALPQPEYQRFTGALVLAQLISCAAACALLAVAGWLIARVHAPAGNLLLVLAVVVVPWMAQDFVRRVLYTRGESRAAAINDGVTYGLRLVGALLLVGAAGTATAVSALWVLGLTSAMGVLVGLWQLRHHVRMGGRGSLAGVARTWREAWDFGKWLTAQNAMLWFGSQGHAWVVGILLGAEQVGLYRAATHLANVMNPVFQTAFSYLPSRGSRAYHAGGVAGLSQWVKRVSWALLLPVLPFVVVLAGFPGQVLELAYGGKYAGTNLALILGLATIGQCILYSKFPFDIGLLALRSTKSIFYVYLIPVALLLTAGTALIYFLGIVGVPLSGILINSALLAATWLAYRKRVMRGEAP
ncbi:MAG: oligosaccharide flippase family protein [Burkholderiales bacterium]